MILVNTCDEERKRKMIESFNDTKDVSLTSVTGLKSFHERRRSMIVATKLGTK